MWMEVPGCLSGSLTVYTIAVKVRAFLMSIIFRSTICVPAGWSMAAGGCKQKGFSGMSSKVFTFFCKEMFRTDGIGLVSVIGNMHCIPAGFWVVGCVWADFLLCGYFDTWSWICSHFRMSILDIAQGTPSSNLDGRGSLLEHLVMQISLLNLLPKVNPTKSKRFSFTEGLFKFIYVKNKLLQNFSLLHFSSH